MADKPNITKEGYVAQLVRVGVWATPQNPIQYAFLEQKPAYLPNEPGWTVLTAAQRAAVQQAFAMIAEVVNLTFVQVPDNQQQPGPNNPRINFYANSVELSYSGSMDAYQFDGSSAIHGADIRFNTSRIAQRQNNEGWWDFTSFVALHEVLHAMGLSHPGNYNGQGPTYQTHAEFVEDTVQYSVMSYFGAANTGADHTIGSVLYGGRTPLLYDILALQSLYSPNMTTRAGDTVYGFNSNTGANSPFNFAVTTGPVIAIWDAGGIDTIDLSGYAGASLIDLNEGAFSDAGGLTKNIAIAFNVTIENAVGGPGADRLVGNAVGNRLDGGAGADQLEGGPGDDVYVVDNPGDAVVELAGAGNDEVRTALAAYVLPANVEALTGISPAAQALTGNDLANTLTGGAGGDSLSGGAADDTLTGGAGNDSLEGGGGDDDTAVYAGNRADYEIGTAGQVTVRDLNAANGDEGTDSLNGIENVRFADMVVRLGVDPNNAPRLGDPAMVDQAWFDGVAASYTIPETSFIDLDGQHTLSFQATLASGAPLPSWLSFNSATRTFSGTPPLEQVGVPLTVRVTASDGKESVFDDFVIVVSQSRGADVFGTAGADVLDGTFRDETLYGDAGDDTLRGSAGADRLDGHAGTDTADYSASPAGVTINLVTGFGSGGHAEGDQLISIERVIGSSHSDRIIGGADFGRFDGGPGADTMEGGAGDDVYLVDDPGDAVVERANEGMDEVRTTFASQVLADHVERLTGLLATGQTLTGNALANVIVAGAGADRLEGGGGADWLAGGLGNDIYVVEEDADTVTEAADTGIDEVRTGLAVYALDANVEHLTGTSGSGQALTGNGLSNILTGGSGDDTLDGGLGADQLIGGLGNDLYFVDGGDVVVEAADSGQDEVRTALATYTLPANVERLSGTSSLRQTLIGNAGANTLSGTGGIDRLEGLAGDDFYVVDRAEDVVVETAGQGYDTVFSPVSYTLAPGAEVEALATRDRAGTQAIDFTGNEFGNRLYGNAGTNRLSGGAGDDRLEGGDGEDRLDGGADNDSASYAAAAAAVVVSLAIAAAQDTGGAGVDTLVDVENLTGSSFGDTLAGNAFANQLDGLEGDDTLLGAGGDDVLRGGAGTNMIDGGEGDDVVVSVGRGVDFIQGGAGNDFALLDWATQILAFSTASGGEVAFGNFADTAATLTGVETIRIITGSGADSITTLGGDDEIRTGAGDDYLNGAGGDDVLHGGAGSNRIEGGEGDDFVFSVGRGVDFIQGGAGNDVAVVDWSAQTLAFSTASGGEVAFGNFVDTAVTLTGVEAIKISTGSGADSITTLGGDDEIRTGAGDDYLNGAGGNDVLYGGTGSNMIDGGDGDDFIVSLERGVDFIQGGAGHDVAVIDWSAQTLAFSTASGGEVAFGNFVDTAATLTGVETIGITTGSGADSITTLGGDDVIRTGAGNDYLNGAGGDDYLDGGAGADAMAGGSGDDVFLVDDPADSILENAGEGVDEVRTGLAAYSLFGTNLERLTAASDAAHDFRGNGGSNLLTGGGGNDLLRLNDGGDDVANGGAGNDVVYFGGAFDGTDVADGGADRDVLVLQGNYTLALSATNLAGIESLSLQSGARTTWGDTADNFYDYDITMADANVAAGVQLIVNAQSLRTGEDFTFDGSAETDGRFLVYAGHGVDILTGGAGGDVFFFEGQRWGADDRVDGGGGRDSVVISAGSGLNRFVFGESSFANIESISLNARFVSDPTQKPSYELVLANGNVAPGASLILNGNSLTDPGQFVHFDGRAVTGGSLLLFGGASHDTLRGGSGADLLLGGRGADSLVGGGGADIFRYDAATDSVAGLADVIADFAVGLDKVDLSRIDANSGAAGDQAFTFIGSSAFSGTAGELRVREENGFQWAEGDVNGDGAADLVIGFQIGAAPLAAGDFIL